MAIDEIFDAPPTLETRGLRLLVIDHDVGETIAARVAPDAIPWSALVALPASLQGTIESDSMEEPFSSHRLNPWRVERRSDGSALGVCAFLIWSLPHDRGLLACAIDEEMEDHEAEELLRTLIDFGFDRMGLNRIEARSAASEGRMRELYERAGLSTEVVLREHLHFEKGYHDVVVQSILRSEWRESIDDA